MKGFSVTNLKYMRMLAESWSFEEISQAPLDQLTWYHLLTLQTKLISKEERLKYAALAVQHGWSRNVLVHHIELRTAERIGSAQNNFEITLAPPQSDLVRETLKDPYKLEFLGLSADVRERERTACEGVESEDSKPRTPVYQQKRKWNPGNLW